MNEGESDDGHVALLNDLQQLLSEAEKFEFHDYKNTKYALPKIELRKKLIDLGDAVVAGKYDNG